MLFLIDRIGIRLERPTNQPEADVHRARRALESYLLAMPPAYAPELAGKVEFLPELPGYRQRYSPEPTPVQPGFVDFCVFIQHYPAYREVTSDGRVI